MSSDSRKIIAVVSATGHVPRFSGKALIDPIVRDAGFEHYTFVVAPFYYQNFLDAMAAQQQSDGSRGWALPIDPKARAIHWSDGIALAANVAGKTPTRFSSWTRVNLPSTVPAGSPQ